jgi:hypothetical protein
MQAFGPHEPAPIPWHAKDISLFRSIQQPLPMWRRFGLHGFLPMSKEREPLQGSWAFISQRPTHITQAHAYTRGPRIMIHPSRVPGRSQGYLSICTERE